MTRAIVAAMCIMLVGCGPGEPTDRTITHLPDQNAAFVEHIIVKIPDGTVPCVIIKSNGGSGITCNWNATDPKGSTP